MGTKNQFDLLVDVDNDDPSHLIAAAEKKAAASPRPAAPSKLPTKPPPPAQADVEMCQSVAGKGVQELWCSDAMDQGVVVVASVEAGRAKGVILVRVIPIVWREDLQSSDRSHGPRQPYRGGSRRGGYTGGEAGAESGRVPHHAYERHSGTGRGYGMKREGAGRGNWGAMTDEALAQESAEAVNIEVAAAMTEDENKQEDVLESEVEKHKEGEPNEEEEKEPEDKEMTLEEYEKVLEEKRKALLSLKAEERKVVVDKELQSMQQLSVKRDSDEVFIKLGSDKDKKKESVERDERTRKSLSINEFLKPAEGERYYSPGGRGRGRGRGRGDRGGFRDGYSSRGPVAAPAIEDQAQFPSLAGR
uniref:Hyaluronan/mRNA-binding protein domain-containing protein n=1 Tax=Leersia perrieri TaxID=77586 RepID=A0A0D9V2M7_9ORYZ